MGFFDAFTGGGTARGAQQSIRVNNEALGRTVDVANANKDEAWRTSADALAAGRDAIGNGFNLARTEYGNARDLYAPYATTGGAAFGQLADASGVNGAEGSARAAAAFRASPGYEWSRDQALEGVARKASATGSLGSGNTLTALQDRAANLADQEYGTYTGRLMNLAQVGYNATGQQAALTKGIGDLGANEGTAVAGLIADDANRRIGAGNVYTNALSGAFGANAAGNSAALLARGRAQDQGGANLVGTMVNLAGLGLYGAGRFA